MSITFTLSLLRILRSSLGSVDSPTSSGMLATLAVSLSLASVRKGGILATSCAAGVFASCELRDSLHKLGHHHGVALIALSRLARAVSTIEVASKDATEAFGRRASHHRWLCAAALLAALCEVLDDLRPGGHHGTALLALADFRDTTEHATSSGPIARFCSSPFARASLGLAALGFAAIELLRDSSVGAHHGVAVLAGAYVLKNGGDLVVLLCDRLLRSRWRHTWRPI